MSKKRDEKFFGVDTGGTFTDVVLRDRQGKLSFHKVLSTPDDPSLAIAGGVEHLVEPDEFPNTHVVHGTTVATNALLERHGARCAFITTSGFEDLLFLRRQNRPELYNFHVQVPGALVEPENCYGVHERITYDGAVITALTPACITQVLNWLQHIDCEAVAICLLHAYVNPTHERMLADAISRALPDIHISTSHEVVREFREYERASTTTVNAYVGPVMSHYLGALEKRLPVNAIEILQSHGGRTSTTHAAQFPVHTALSGPAGGVVGALSAAHEIGIDRIISFDMGGTSTDVSLCNGEPSLAYQSTIDDLPLLVPVIDIYTVGAGGGSIAALDPGGALRVGPRSAGAKPGPAAYGLGGTLPTVTDAHVFLGRLRCDRFLGGTMQLDEQAAHHALETLASSMKLTPEDLALGILDVADAAMARAIKVVSMERGFDPRDFTLVSFGGAGGLHACQLAEHLEIPRVLVPLHPGLLSAYGMLHADVQRLYSRTLLMRLSELSSGSDGQATLTTVLSEMHALACRDLRARPTEIQCSVFADLRYEGQSFEISVPVDWKHNSAMFSDPTQDFEAHHQKLYGYIAHGRTIELVNLRLRARRNAMNGTTHHDQCFAREVRGRAVEPEVDEVLFRQGALKTQVFERSDLMHGQCIAGPAVIAEYSGTTVISPGWHAVVQKGHLVIERGRSMEKGQ